MSQFITLNDGRRTQVGIDANGELVVSMHNPFGQTVPATLDQLTPALANEIVAHVFTTSQAALAALKDFAQETVWADCRLPGDMRDDLKAKYHNTVCPIIAKAEGR